MNRLHEIAEEATKGIDALLVSHLTEEQSAQVAEIIEKAVVKALLEGQHRAVDAAIGCAEADQDQAHKIATAIRHKNDALIVNLASLR
jgi:GGDEF domain-containing protein